MWNVNWFFVSVQSKFQGHYGHNAKLILNFHKHSRPVANQTWRRIIKWFSNNARLRNVSLRHTHSYARAYTDTRLKTESWNFRPIQFRTQALEWSAALLFTKQLRIHDIPSRQNQNQNWSSLSRQSRRTLDSNDSLSCIKIQQSFVISRVIRSATRTSPEHFDRITITHYIYNKYELSSRMMIPSTWSCIVCCVVVVSLIVLWMRLLLLFWFRMAVAVAVAVVAIVLWCGFVGRFIKLVVFTWCMPQSWIRFISISL